MDSKEPQKSCHNSSYCACPYNGSHATHNEGFMGIEWCDNGHTFLGMIGLSRVHCNQFIPRDADATLQPH